MARCINAGMRRESWNVQHHQCTKRGRGEGGVTVSHQAREPPALRKMLYNQYTIGLEVQIPRSSDEYKTAIMCRMNMQLHGMTCVCK